MEKTTSNLESKFNHIEKTISNLESKFGVFCFNVCLIDLPTEIQAFSEAQLNMVCTVACFKKENHA